MKVSRLLFSAVLIASLSACTQSETTETTSGPVDPSGGFPSPTPNPRDSYMEYGKLKMRLKHEYGCDVAQRFCEAASYPKAKTQIEEMEKALALAQKIMGEGRMEMFVRDDVPFLKVRIADLRKELAAFEQAMPGLKKRLAELESERAKLADQITAKGCSVPDRNSWIVECPKLENLEAFEVRASINPLLQQLEGNLAATEDTLASLKAPTTMPSALNNVRAVRQNWFHVCRQSAHILLSPAMEDLAKSIEGLVYDDESDWLRDVSECDDYSVTKEKLKIVSAFKEAMLAALPAKRAAAMDRLTVTLPGDEKGGFARYEDSAYKFHPSSKEGLRVKVPLSANRQQLEDFFNKLDRAGNAKFKKRAEKLKSIADKMAAYPKKVENGPFRLSVELDIFQLDSMLKDNDIYKFAEILDEVTETAVNHVQTENDYIRKFAADGYTLPAAGVSIRVVLGPYLQCPSKPNADQDGWLIRGSLGDWDRVMLPSCIWDVSQYYKKKTK